MIPLIEVSKVVKLIEAENKMVVDRRLGKRGKLGVDNQQVESFSYAR